MVSSSGPYNTASYPQGVAEGGNNQQYGQPPPDYFNGLEDSGFSNATLRRGKKEKRKKSFFVFYFLWQELKRGQQYLLLNLFAWNWFAIKFIFPWPVLFPAYSCRAHSENHFNARMEFGENWKTTLTPWLLYSGRLFFPLHHYLSSSCVFILTSRTPATHCVFFFFWTGFIRKVYLTLMLQLLVTVGIICAFLYW